MSQHRSFPDRRQFLGILTASGVGLAGGSLSTESRAADEEVPVRPLVDSPPVLQCPMENGIAVVWAVGSPATSFVEFGTNKDHLDQVAFGEVLGLKSFHDRFLQVRLEGLEPATQYFYRSATAPFIFHHGHKLERKDPVYSETFSFETPDARKSTGTFSVINDTHNNQETLKILAGKLREVDSDYTIWNGDLADSFDGADMAVQAVLRAGGGGFATEKPILFVPGNHDYRGVWARNSSLPLATWDHAAPEDRRMIRNFVVRNGPVAMIGLDTGEDKPDWHPAWAGQAFFEPYRTAQRDWLERALKSETVATAPYVVAFCHIPLYDSRPDANGGDVLEKWADFQRQAGNLWGPLFTEHGVQLVVAAHMHRFRYDAPTEDRPWAQIVGGGHSPKGQITMIHGKANADSLEVVVDELNSQSELGRWKFEPRKI